MPLSFPVAFFLQTDNHSFLKKNNNNKFKKVQTAALCSYTK